ncbi:MAG: cobalamin-dependent protein [Deltaproteobacteria bacterium]|nr:cobalamin-dependent protein [Deltaproteobacteria bacterium]MBW2170538.1 cobalamin-dependent protein [Deltaproteobacteria bacterium]
MSETDIVFINPPISLTERYGKLSSSGSLAPPLGLCHLASVCRNEGFSTAIVDSSPLGLSHSEVVQEVFSHNPRVIGITASTVSIQSAARIADLIKQRDSAKEVIIGGPHVTAVPVPTMELYGGFDLGVIGEGEHTITELLHTLWARGDLSSVKGVLFRDNHRICQNRKRKPITNLDELPIPAWDLLPELRHFYKPVSLSYSQLPSTSLITSRGCSGKCTFCDRTVFGNVCRGFSADYLFEMVKELYDRYHIRDILFDDDNFIMFKPRLAKFCELLSASGLGLTWACNARVDIVDMATLKLMAEAGCWQIAYGIESGNQKILDVLRKGITLQQIRSALTITRQAGIQTKGFFMIGSPLETRKTMEDTIRFMLELPLDDFQTTFFTPLPGCELYETVETYGKLEDDWSKMNMWYPVFIPRGLSKHELVVYAKRAFRKFYFRPRIMWGYLKTLRKPGSVAKLAVGVYSMLRYQLTA